jgi:hypothetical protein
VPVHLKRLSAEGQCAQTGRAWRWPAGVACPSGEAHQGSTRGFADTVPARQRSAWHDGAPRVDELRAPIVAGQHPPLPGGLGCR